MKTIHKEELYVKNDDLIDKIYDEESIFFDIETTGFSPTSASVYLIGCARRKGKHICIDQFFAESPREEKVIISAFVELLKQYRTIISFNGIGFDIPFLKAKCDLYGVAENFSGYNYIDIFKSVSQLKFLLNLENYKQKTVEKFLGIDRADKYNGGELINVYYDYVRTKDDEALELLMLHNYEDVLGMTSLLPILSYTEFFNGQYSITESKIEPYKTIDGEEKYEFIISLKNDYLIPKRLSKKTDSFYLILNKETASIRVPVYSGELKYFFENYKDYYYLPEEDRAVHKSVAGFVDKDFREKCHANNCYTRKQGDFLIQYYDIMNPEFKADYKDKFSYFELTDDFCESDVMLRRYVEHILKVLASGK